MIAGEVKNNKDKVGKTIVAGLRKMKVPHSRAGTAACRNFIAIAESYPSFFRIVTGDESEYFAYNPTTNRQFAAGSEKLRKSRQNWDFRSLM